MIQLVAAHHVSFDVADLAGSQRFCHDFGFEVAAHTDDTCWFRGAGRDAYSFVAHQAPQTRLRGLALRVESRSDLQQAAQLPGASALRPLDGPGGGEVVTLMDPDGIAIDLVHGIAQNTPQPLRADLVLNTPDQRRRLGSSQVQPAHGRQPLIRFGHAGLYVKDVVASSEWYRQTLGLCVSDSVHAGPHKMPIAAFLRINRGGAWVDHHTLALFAGPGKGAQHLSFEVQDSESQMLAHDWLRSRGWASCWGVGRHTLGSHVFDVWWDPNDIRFETFSDTDLLTANHPTGNHPSGPALTRWGTDMPKEYILPRGTKGFMSDPHD